MSEASAVIAPVDAAGVVELHGGPGAGTASAASASASAPEPAQPRAAGGGKPARTGAPRIVGVQFRRAAAMIYDFDAGDLPVRHDDRVVVESDRGEELGWAVGPAEEREPHTDAPLRRVLRVATAADLARDRSLRQREREALRHCAGRARALSLPMKVVACEWAHRGEKATFYFSSEERVDFRSLVRELAQHNRARIEMRQVGPRDETKIIGALGPCGRETCCSSWLRAFVPVGIRMAKDQGLALNPQKVSGVCGRLLCCLSYEQDVYRDLRKRLPRVGRQVETPQGRGKVVDVLVLRERVRVRLEGLDSEHEFEPARVRPLGAPPPEEPDEAGDAVDAAAPAPQPVPPAREGRSRQGPPGRERSPEARGGQASQRAPSAEPARPQHEAHRDRPQRGEPRAKADARPSQPGGPPDLTRQSQPGAPHQPPQQGRPNRPEQKPNGNRQHGQKPDEQRPQGRKPGDQRPHGQRSDQRPHAAPAPEQKQDRADNRPQLEPESAAAPPATQAPGAPRSDRAERFRRRGRGGGAQGPSGQDRQARNDKGPQEQNAPRQPQQDAPRQPQQNAPRQPQQNAPRQPQNAPRPTSPQPAAATPPAPGTPPAAGSAAGEQKPSGRHRRRHRRPGAPDSGGGGGGEAS